MQNYARVDANLVLEIWQPPAEFPQWTPEVVFSGPEYASQFPGTWLACPDNVVPGFTFSNNVWQVPVSPSLTPAEQATAAIFLGCKIVSTSNSELTGTYNISMVDQTKIISIVLYIVVNNKFPGGSSTYPWVDLLGTVHTFPSTTEFLLFATAIADYVAQLDIITTTNTGALPIQPITIA